MRKLICSSLIILILSSCSWMDVVDLITPSKGGGISAELVIGDKNQEIKTEIGAKTNNQSAETIVNNITESASVFWILFAFLGWMLPSPQSMWTKWRNRNA